MDNKETLATGTLAELNERYGLPTDTPLEMLLDVVMEGMEYRFNLETTQNGPYITIKAT